MWNSRITRRQLLLSGVCLWGVASAGCTVVPDVSHKPTFHNPFPQLQRVAVLPFYNQSKEPTVDGDSIAIAYYNEVQHIPGFEVMPVGVAKQVLLASNAEPRSGADFQRVAQLLGVDAVIVGSITEYSPYYPPRIGLSVDWYAANPGFHPIPAGYGLPWGTADEEYIPDRLKHEAEFALAREQLATQTPEIAVDPAVQPTESNAASRMKAQFRTAGLRRTANPQEPERLPAPLAVKAEPASSEGLPPDWPDPRGFMPAQPQPKRPAARPQSKPIMTHTKLYNGKDGDFTEQLSHYVYQLDDARYGGWQAYLQRPEDFIHFCCHLHVTETLAARGGAGKTELIVRWPASR